MPLAASRSRQPAASQRKGSPARSLAICGTGAPALTDAEDGDASGFMRGEMRRVGTQHTIPCRPERRQSRIARARPASADPLAGVAPDPHPGTELPLPRSPCGLEQKEEQLPPPAP